MRTRRAATRPGSRRAAVSTLAAVAVLAALILLAPSLPADPHTVGEHAVRWGWGALLVGTGAWSLVLMYRNGTGRRPQPPRSPSRARL